MDAMHYEYLLRRIYQVGRYGKKNVDADVYREFERAEHLYKLELKNIEEKKSRLRSDSIEDLAYDCRVQRSRIWRIISVAITYGIEKYRHQFNAIEMRTLEELTTQPVNLTKEDIDLAIKGAEAIFVKHEIYPA